MYSVNGYGILNAVGAVLFFAFAYLLARKHEADVLNVLRTAGVLLIVSVASGALFFELFYLNRSEASIPLIGASSALGTAFILFGCLFLAKQLCSGSMTRMVSIAVISVSSLAAVGKFGCGYAGCCAGVGLIIPVGAGYSISQQVLEGIVLSTWSSLMLWRAFKINTTHLSVDAMIALAGYSALRFVFEGLRNDEAQLLIGIRVPIIASIGLCLLSTTVALFWKADSTR